MFGKESKMRKIIKKDKLELEDVLYVGDEIRDIHAAKNTGIDIASVAWGYNTVESLKKHKPEYIIYEPFELIDICKS
jgi:phosphoglycolate phosphatase-like HAD superfamily hydrolase